MANLKSNWIRSDEQKFTPWEGGFQPADLINEYASGSSNIGQLADLLSTGTEGTWPVASKQSTVADFILEHREISAGWSSIFIFLDGETEEELIIRTTAEKIEYIRDNFGISVSQLAKILRTSRPTIYSWLEDEVPREQSAQRVQQIYEITTQWSGMNSYHFSPGPLLRQTLGKSPSLLEQLEREDLNLEDIQSGLTAILELMHRRRDRMDRSKERTQDSKISARAKEENRHRLTHTVSSAE